MTFLNGDSAAIYLTKNHPDLLKRLHDKFSDPVDSYWNGSHTWFSAFGDIDLEWRVHPVSGFKMPEASRPEDLFDLALEGELEIDHYWEGLEVFTISEQICTPQELADHVTTILEIPPDASGTVDHDSVGNQYEHASGNVSIIQLLLNQLE